MPIRTIRSQVTFTGPFNLAEVGNELPAGTYNVDTDEEVIEGNERTVYVRVATLLHVHSLGSTRAVTVDPEALEAALERDSGADLARP